MRLLTTCGLGQLNEKYENGHCYLLGLRSVDGKCFSYLLTGSLVALAGELRGPCPVWPFGGRRIDERLRTLRGGG